MGQIPSKFIMIKESLNLIGPKAQLATPNRKRQFQMLPSLDNYLHAKN